MFFNEEGILNIDEMVVNNASFKNIMEDGVITEEEIKAQSDKVVAMLHEMEAKYSEEQLTEIKNLLVESSVLYAVYNFHSIQNINNIELWQHSIQKRHYMVHHHSFLQ
ncbi:MAG: hypothetical protein Q4A54_11065 [Parabacteroides sp.]|nr:hypothetical protein [Parabacteroides sp.]